MFKHTKKILVSLFILAGIIIFISCQEQQPVATNDTGQMRLSKVSSFIMPPGATLVSANLKLYALSWAADPQIVELHNITSDWSCPTWNTFAGAFNSAVITTFNTGNAGGGPIWKTINITSTVQAWLDGVTNYGLLLKNQDILQGFAQWASNEYPDTNFRPYLEIITTGGTFQIQPLYDTYIKQIDANTSYCNEELLYSGFITYPDGYTTHKYTLIRFDIEPTGGCTLTPGYWKTHSEFGPAPYDDTWAQLPNGASTTFFFSEKSYYQVLWTAPRGNAYYILAHAYIAAKLNKLNGADFTAAQAAFTAATVLFSNPINTPAYIGSLKGNNPVRQQFISLAGILDNYNNGIIGPGHCD